MIRKNIGGLLLAVLLAGCGHGISQERTKVSSSQDYVSVQTTYKDPAGVSVNSTRDTGLLCGDQVVFDPSLGRQVLVHDLCVPIASDMIGTPAPFAQFGTTAVSAGIDAAGYWLGSRALRPDRGGNTSVSAGGGNAQTGDVDVNQDVDQDVGVKVNNKSSSRSDADAIAQQQQSQRGVQRRGGLPHLPAPNRGRGGGQTACIHSNCRG